MTGSDDLLLKVEMVQKKIKIQRRRKVKEAVVEEEVVGVVETEEQDRLKEQDFLEISSKEL